jgi:hypothetical protein
MSLITNIYVTQLQVYKQSHKYKHKTRFKSIYLFLIALWTFPNIHRRSFKCWGPSRYKGPPLVGLFWADVWLIMYLHFFSCFSLYLKYNQNLSNKLHKHNLKCKKINARKVSKEKRREDANQTRWFIVVRHEAPLRPTPLPEYHTRELLH